MRTRGEKSFTVRPDHIICGLVNLVRFTKDKMSPPCSYYYSHRIPKAIGIRMILVNIVL